MSVRGTTQFYSRTAAISFQKYSSNDAPSYPKSKFKGRLPNYLFSVLLLNINFFLTEIETTISCTQTFNDIFDVLNGRHLKESITVGNWHKKKRILDEMLKIVDHTEAINRAGDCPIKMFASQTTIESWRLSIQSAITLTEELFSAGYSYVLTGKWNQDPLEVSAEIQMSAFQNNY